MQTAEGGWDREEEKAIIVKYDSPHGNDAEGQR